MSTTAVDTVDALRLAMAERVGPRTFGRLVERFGTPGAALEASEDALVEVEGVGTVGVRGLRGAPGREAAEAVLRAAEAAGVRVVVRGQPAYPPLLAEIPDAPPVLWYLGALPPEEALPVAIVGARRASTYGLSVARRLAAALAARGVPIVSGLAMGIDTAAHRGALDAAGHTVAVLGCGFETAPPARGRGSARPAPPGRVDAALLPGLTERGRRLAAEILDRGGAIVTEFMPGTPSRPDHFPRRNRIISGLAKGVVVVEAAVHSGSLITAHWGNEQGRDVMAIPGPVDQPTSQGTNALIRDGAVLVRDAADVLEAMELEVPAPPGGEAIPGRDPGAAAAGSDGAMPPGRSDAERSTLDALGRGPLTPGEIVEATGLPVSPALRAISALERVRLVRRRPDGAYERC